MAKLKKYGTVQSPLIAYNVARHVRDVPVSFIVAGYEKYGLDVTRFFSGLEELSIFECTVSGLQFFHPGNVMGDSDFYSALERFDWYYMPWKWEHQVAKSKIADGMNILEIGCAHGAFLSTISDQFSLPTLVGLELNEETPIENEFFSIRNEDIQSHEAHNSNFYDIVCSFQVLEHIAEPESFLRAAIGCLKPGGKLLISVPNNEGFVGAKESVLNMPPHHVGLWNSRSLKYIENIYPVSLVDIVYEPLQDYHVEAYINAFYYSGLSGVIPKIRRKIDVMLGRYEKKYNSVMLEKESLRGHTVMAVFEKHAR